MVRRSAFRSTVLALALCAARVASADPITFTGNVANDFNPTTNTGVQVTPIDSDPTGNIFQFPEMTNAGFINGYAIKDVRMEYNAKTDTMSVGLNTYSIAGSAVGNGGQAMDNILMNTYHGVDPANIGGDKSITVGFYGNNPSSPNAPGSAVFVAGVPADKTLAGDNGLDKFTVASWKGSPNGIQANYGAVLTNNLGALAFNPDASHPNFEFTIANFSKISSTVDPTKGFWFKVYAGSGQDNPIGEEAGQGFYKVPGFPQQQQIPEPTTWLAWSLVGAGGAAFRLRRRATA
jgi:hypothetical protein